MESESRILCRAALSVSRMKSESRTLCRMFCVSRMRNASRILCRTLRVLLNDELMSCWSMVRKCCG